MEFDIKMKNALIEKQIDAAASERNNDSKPKRMMRNQEAKLMMRWD